MMRPEEYWQRHPLWAGKHYGLPQAAVTSTIGRYGCKMCCYAYILGITPPQLQDEFAANGCYADDPARWYNYVLDGKVCQLFNQSLRGGGRVDCQDTPAPIALIDGLLQLNNFVMVYVDARENMSATERAKYDDYFQHYVLIVDKTLDGYKIFDPFFGDAVLLTSRYGRTDSIAIGGVIKLARVQAVPYTDRWDVTGQIARARLAGNAI